MISISFGKKTILQGTVYWLDNDGNVRSGYIVDIALDCDDGSTPDPLTPDKVFISKKEVKRHVSSALVKKKKELELQIAELDEKIENELPDL